MRSPEPRTWRPLVGVLSAQAVAWTGTRVAGIALPWFVLTTTGSAVQTGLVVFAQMGPYVVAQALAGPFIDRVGPRRISVAGDLVAASAVAMIPFLHGLGMLSIGLLMVVVAIAGAADGPANAAKSVFIPEITESAQLPLERVTGLSSTVERLASTVGPAFGGVLVASVGGPSALWITAGLIAAGAAIIAWAAPSRRAAPPQDGAKEGYATRLRAGAQFLRRDGLLRSIIVMVAITNLLDAALTSVLLPVWVHTSGHGAAMLGMLVSVTSGFAIGASVVAAIVGHRLPRRAVFLVGFLIAGAPRFAVLAFDVPLELIISVMAVAGFGSGFLNPILGAVQFERIPAQLLGRVRTLIGAVAWSGIPFGGLLGGVLIAVVGLTPALLASGAAYLVATTVPGLRPEWAGMNRAHHEP